MDGMSLGSRTDLNKIKKKRQRTHTEHRCREEEWWGGVKRRVSQALTSSLGFQRELEKVTEEQRERKKTVGGRERQHRLMWLSHAMHTTGTFGQGPGEIRKKAVFWELLQKPLETRCSDSLWCLQFFLSSQIQGGNMVPTQTSYFLLWYRTVLYNAVRTMMLSRRAS